MLLELGTGRTRPMRMTHPSFASPSRFGDDFALEEHPPAAWESNNVTLLNSAIFVIMGEPALLEWSSRGKSVSKTITPGEVSILPAHQPYSARLRAAGGSLIVSLDQKALACAAAEQGGMGQVEPDWAHGIDDALLRELALALRAEMRQAEANPSYVQSLVSALASHVVRRYSRDRLRVAERRGGLALPALRRAIRFIQDHLAEDISLERLAAAEELSACHFARMFKQAAGMSPHQYILNCRLARARQLLLNRSITLAETALQSGFCDQGHMTRVFRQFLGTTPASYARNLRNEARPLAQTDE